MVQISDFSDSLATDTSDVTYTATKGTKQAVPRNSLRLTAYADPSSTITKAVKRVRNKEVGSSNSGGMPLIHNFPYLRFTEEQISELFGVYQISLGNCASDVPFIIAAIKQLDMKHFENVIKQILKASKGQTRNVRLTLDLLDSTAIVVTSGKSGFP